nr:MAG TPA: Endodeoxyribonuclease RusA [Caudoviricetes sp.]
MRAKKNAAESAHKPHGASEQRIANAEPPKAPVSFLIPGKPQGKARPRFAAGHAYTDERTKQYEDITALLYRRAAEGQAFPKGTPVSVEITLCFAPPKSKPKKTRDAMLAGEILPLVKPDADNAAKIILDALNGIAYEDDTQVTVLTVTKAYAASNFVTVTLKTAERK